MTLIVSGCKNEYNNPTPLPSAKHEPGLIKDIKDLSPNIKTIEVREGEFNTVSGWLDNDTILYIADINQGSSVFSHNLTTGEEKLLFESSFPIVSVIVSPLKEYFLVHSSPSTNDAQITVLTKDGKQVFEDSIPSTELNIEWNLYNESSILLTAFTEDWEFTVWNLNIETNRLTDVPLPQPFGFWNGEDELLYLDWDMEAPSLYADLKKFSLITNESTDIKPQVLQVDTLKDGFMTIEVEEEHSQNAIYTFFTSNAEELFSYKTPHLSSYSDWLVPYYDFNQEGNRLLIYQPLHYGEADTYKDGFQLVSYDIKTGSSSVLLENMDNEPLSCTSDGEKCLSGFYLEKLIYVNSKEIISLVEDNSLE
jgi:hypothetical protein